MQLARLLRQLVRCGPEDRAGRSKCRSTTRRTPPRPVTAAGAQAISACGKYLFVAYGYGYIRVHRLKDGAYIGTLRPDINGFKGSGGCVDSDNALNVTLRKNGEYVLFLENAGRNHVMMFRWTPPGDRD